MRSLVKTFVIIGGGAAGVSTLYTFVDSLGKTASEEKYKIVVIEKSPVIGPGLAYSLQASDVFLLNLPYDVISPVPKHPDHFAKWLHSNEGKWRSEFPTLDLSKDMFLPRRLFGIYLNDLANSLQKIGREQGLDVVFIKAEVIDINKNFDETLIVQYKDNEICQTINATSVVLCTGHLPPSQPAYQKFKELNGYYSTPWEIDTSKIPLDEDILILGTHLTAIDAILQRAEVIKKAIKERPQGKIGKIIAVSHSGHLPRVICNTSQEYVRKYLTLEAIEVATESGTATVTLDSIKTMFKNEVKRAYETLGFEAVNAFQIRKLKKPCDQATLLESEIQAARNQTCRPWQVILFSIYPFVPRIWEALDGEGKEKFIKKYYSIWMTYLAAFPLKNAEVIYSLMKEERLEVAGGLKKVVHDPNTSEFVTHLKVNKSLTITKKTKYVINAAGQGHDITSAESVLIKKLLENKFINPHALGGIEVDFKTLRVTSEHKHLPLYVIGDQTWGACMATGDLIQIAHQASRVVNSILHPKKKWPSNSRLSFHKLEQGKRDEVKPEPGNDGTLDSAADKSSVARVY